MAVCEQWVVACEHLTGQVWKRYSPHPWSREKHHPQGLQSLAQRLEEVRLTPVNHLMQYNLVHYLMSCVCVLGAAGSIWEWETAAVVIWREAAGFCRTCVSAFHRTQPHTLQPLYWGTWMHRIFTIILNIWYVTQLYHCKSVFSPYGELQCLSSIDSSLQQNRKQLESSRPS